jgi:hypothetical protein
MVVSPCKPVQGEGGFLEMRVGDPTGHIDLSRQGFTAAAVAVVDSGPNPYCCSLIATS